ncbi:MAG: tetratricopeptide repeat protein [Holophagales bacterium]|nr:tetratricopeptide repeat protein [Holophagales bacterium]
MKTRNAIQPRAIRIPCRRRPFCSGRARASASAGLAIAPGLVLLGVLLPGQVWAASPDRESPDLARQVATLKDRDLGLGSGQVFDPDRLLRRLIGSGSVLPGATSPDASLLAQAHLELGHRERRDTRVDRAIAHYQRAVRLDPELGEAHLALGTLLGQQGRFRGSAQAFAWLAELDPRDPRAYLGRARALGGLGYYRLARRTLEDAVEKLPEEPELLHSLARLLAASPDPAARNGTRALDLAQKALGLGRKAPYAETLAMAMAETGLFTDAAALLEAILAQARGSAAEDAFVERLEAQLELYRAGRPFRLPEVAR